MIIIRVKSRLGDQLIKYMNGRALAKHKRTTLCVDKSLSKKNGYYLNDLGFHPIEIDITKFGDYYPLKGGTMAYTQKFFKLPNNIIFYGLYYHYKYFDNIIEDVRKEIKRVDMESGTIGIHVRRGDFVHIPNRIPCDVKYVKKAIRKFRSKRYLITTDDKKWCKENILPLVPNGELSLSESPVEDFLKLVSCDKLIISSSAFSWCAAVIADVPTICPGKWFVSGQKSKIKSDHCPPEWIRI